MRPIAIFYHCLFFKDSVATPYHNSGPIIAEQMKQLTDSGLLEEAKEFVVGINGTPEESGPLANLYLPSKTRKVYHGLQSKAENLTIVELENWVSDHQGWNVLYFHAKGATHLPGSPYGENVSFPWRRTMMRYLVTNWRQCVADLQEVESVGCHFMRNMADGTQNIWAGNFWWATSDFLRTVPSIFLRERIKVSGIAALESRYESEVWIGNGRLPTVREYLPNGGEGVP